MNLAPDDACDGLTDGRFRIGSRSEIASILRDLMAKHALVAASGGGDAQIVTTILSVEVDTGELVLDWGGTGRIADRLMAASRVLFETSLDQVRVRFASGPPAPTVFDGEAAFRVAIPEFVFRIQRRDSYRLKVPASLRATLVVEAFAQAGPASTSLVLHDISETGACVGASRTDPAAAAGARHERCRLLLPELPPISVGVEVIHVASRNDGAMRYGVRFLGIPERDAATIRRFIARVERDRRMRT
ncbi:MAG: flagellar brake protein [Burkholderiales bacterium]|nr:flagellar brake protein [Burkholderiales bacterium]MCE7877519.1 flagellar brake protein [Betaproteobacteria bacterium PRO3]